MRGSTKKAEVNLSWAVIYGKEATERKSLEGDCREGGGRGGREEERKIGSSGDLMVSSSHLRSTTALSAERPFLS